MLAKTLAMHPWCFTYCMYSRTSEKGPPYYRAGHFIKRMIFALYVCIVTNNRIAVTKISKSVSKETFIEASKVVVKPSKVIN